ncbi:MAG: phosphate regulon transcriptional regulator PhoB [Novosphingobium sp.]|nr:phosphate regulon transcriptional regulator PhoB [Novosphingobium sp.]
MTGSILVVEDDIALRDLLAWNLEAAGYTVRTTSDGEEALLMVREQQPDAIILDWMIEQVPGIEVCRQLRRDSATARIPVVMLTARGEEEDRIRGLKTGADDSVTKPFSTRELMARIEALLRRSKPSLAGELLRVGSIELDPAAHRARRDGAPLHLGPTEFKLLRYFMERPSRVVSRHQILDGVWGLDSDIDERTVDVHIRRLRKAINRPGDTDPIRTVRGAGYAMEAV